jgi:VanZ family protein
VFCVRVPRYLLASILWCALLAWAATILWLSSLSPQQLPSAAFIASDKFNHFAAFMVGGWLAASALRVSWPGGTATRIIAAIILLGLFGATDEASQLFTPGRSGGDIYDWIADFLGASTGALFTLPTHALLVLLVPRP